MNLLPVTLNKVHLFCSIRTTNSYFTLELIFNYKIFIRCKKKSYVLESYKIEIVKFNYIFVLIRWVLRDSPVSPLDIIGYIRYLLVYKRWKEIMSLAKKEQQQIILLACIKLEPPINLKEKLESNDYLRELFPIIPKTEVTKFLMKAKFSSKEKSKVK